MNEKEVWINKRTGEEIEAKQVLHRVARENFEIVYLSYLLDLFDKLGGKRYQVFKYIIANKSYDNTLIITNRELAIKSGVSTYTVTEALNMLRDAGIIKTRTGAIILNAKLMNRGSLGKEAYIMQKFEMFDSKEEELPKQDNKKELEQCYFPGVDIISKVPHEV